LQKPKNLTILVLDNEAYGETGGQVSHTSASADLVGVARACGIPDSRAISTLSEIEVFAREMQDVTSGPRFANAKIDGANLERVLSNRDGMFIMTRLRGALGHAPI
jgi:thiamine pyrophosphate-dependent acetolactate synthase large subunit-like protein